MIETAIALLAAHVIADFVLQFRWIIDNKRRFWVFSSHVAIVALASAILLGAWSGAALAAVLIVTVAHALIDAGKLWQAEKSWVNKHPRGRLILFLADQALHALSIVVTAWYFQAAWAEGWWASAAAHWQTGYLIVLSLTAGFILATRTGGFVLELLMSGFALAGRKPAEDESDPGLIDGGKWIGLLERTLIFILILAQQFQAIGFLVAAKSILRFQYSKERSHGETVIIGTLASFAWAIVFSWATLAVIQLLKAGA